MSRQTKIQMPNLLLDALEPAGRKRVFRYLQTVRVKLGDVICEAGGRLNHVYFPTTAVFSLLTVLEDGSAIETANIGSEGAYGVFAAMYGGQSFSRCQVQFGGNMIRLPMNVLKREFEYSEHVRNLFVSYTETQISQIQQTVACNAMHSIKERICRWLLTMHDRIDGEELPYTHEFLSEMLGANRKSVTLAAQELQAGGFINYHRGKIKVANRKGMQKISCECYAVVRERFDIFLKPPTPVTPSHARRRLRD